MAPLSAAMTLAVARLCVPKRTDKIFNSNRRSQLYSQCMSESKRKRKPGHADRIFQLSGSRDYVVPSCHLAFLSVSLFLLFGGKVGE